MNKIFNPLLFEYSLKSLKRRGSKNIFISIIFIILIFLLSCAFMISNSLKFELFTTLSSLPDIIVQKIKAGRQYDIEKDRIEKILQIPGVSNVIDRVWGYYYYQRAGVNFSVVGLKEFEENYKKNFDSIADAIDFEDFEKKPLMIIGSGVKKILEKNYYKNYFNFVKPNGDFKRVYIKGVFKGESELETNDIILLDEKIAREIFGMPKNKSTDLVVKVANPLEVKTVASKIKLLYPDTRVITKEDLKISYQNIFDYKSGIFLALFIVAVFTFFIIVYDKTSGLTSEEKREIGILKALGWRIEDILTQKFYEAFIISLSSFLIGVILALFYVYFLNAPLIRDIFSGYSVLKPSFNLPFVFDFQTFFLIFFTTVPIYIAACIIPSWRAATLEADEVIR